MIKIDQRIDVYIEKSADYAKPILIHLRNLIHKACPEVIEVIKWGMPHFETHGEILCGFAAFKQHCTFGFWKYSLIKDFQGILTETGEEAMGHLGKIKSLADLPDDKILIAYIIEADRLNKEKIKRPTKPISKEKKELEIPVYFMEALAKDKMALKTFVDFSYSAKKEYVEWVTEAKSEDTRMKRLETAVLWMSEGKKRNWKYEKC